MASLFVFPLNSLLTFNFSKKSEHLRVSLYLRILFDFLSKDNWDLKDYFCLCVILNNGVERLFIKVMAFNSILTPFNFLTPEVG